MKQPLTMVRGTTQIINIQLTDSSGAPYTLAEGEMLRFGLKRRPTDKDYLVSKELTNAHLENGVYVLILDASDTVDLDFGCHYYDVGLQSGAIYFNVIECSEFDVRYNISRLEVSS